MIQAPEPVVIDRAWTLDQLHRNLNRVLNPAVCYRALEMLKKSDSDFDDIASVLQGDPFIAAKVVGLANLMRRAGDPTIASVQRAVAVLGVRQVQTLMIAVMLTGPLVSMDGNVPRRKDLWRWVFGCAAAGDYLGRALHNDDHTKDQRYLVSGLLLGLGPLILHAGLGHEYSNVLGTTVRPLRLAQRERRAWGITHHHVTVWALEGLRCPPELTAPAQVLSDPRDDDETLRARAIEMLAARAVGLEAGRAEAWLVDALPRLGIAAETLVDQAMPAIRTRVRELTRVYEVDLGDWQQQQETRQDVMLMAAQALEAVALDLAMQPHGAAPAASAKDIQSTAASDGQTKVDPLTGLLTRRGWDDHFDRVIPDKPDTTALLMLNIDGFEEFSARVSREHASRGLQVIATVLRSTSSEPMMVGRLGERFAGIYAVKDAAGMSAVVEELNQLLAQPSAAVAGTNLTISVGGVLTTGRHLRSNRRALEERAARNLKAACAGGLGKAVLTADA